MTFLVSWVRYSGPNSNSDIPQGFLYLQSLILNQEHFSGTWLRIPCLLKTQSFLAVVLFVLFLWDLMAASFWWEIRKERGLLRSVDMAFPEHHGCPPADLNFGGTGGYAINADFS